MRSSRLLASWCLEEGGRRLGELNQLLNALPEDRAEANVRLRYVDAMGTVQTAELRSAIEEVPLGSEAERESILVAGAASL